MDAAGVNENRAARIVTWTIIGVNAFLLVISLPNYRVSIDSGYHVSLARWYAAHGSAWWDHINFGPGGRPNLQGPALHVAIAALGTVLGGSADSFILANALLAVAQWTAAILTALYFARKADDDLAAMFAVALLAGSAFASASFYVGIPSGWLFIAIPWAIHFFLEDRLALATMIASLSCYAHLGGFVTVPVGIAIAAAVQRRWRALAIVAIGTALLTSPYWIHFLVNLSWYRGRHGHEAFHVDPLIDLLALAGLVRLLRRPREHLFLLAWAGAPIVWLAQDPNRFVLQSALAGSVIAGTLLAELTEGLSRGGTRIVFASAVVALATIFPLGIPSLLAESAWDAGLHFPLLEDWGEARALAGVIARNHLNHRLLSVYETSFGPAIDVFTPVVLYRGHWVEVQPIHDPADDLSAGFPVYVVPLASNDPTLLSMSGAGLLHIYGGSADSSVIDLSKRGDPVALGPSLSAMVADNAEWLGREAVNNKMPPTGATVKFFSPDALRARRARMDEQRFRAGRIEIAFLIYGYAMEPMSPDQAHRLRNEARGFGFMASFLSDDDPIGFVGDRQLGQSKLDLLALGAAARKDAANSLLSAQVQECLRRLFGEFFGSAA